MEPTKRAHVQAKCDDLEGKKLNSRLLISPKYYYLLLNEFYL